MDVGSAFAEYFEREISVKKRRPRALDSSQRFHRLLHFLSTPVFPRSVFRFFLFRPPRRFFLPPSPLLFFSNPSPLFHGEFHRSLLFPPAPYPPPSPSTRAEDRRAYIGQLPVVSPSLLAYVAQTALDISLPLSLSFAPLQPPFLFFSQSLFSFSPRFNGCTRVRSPRLQEASSGLDWKAADFYPLLVFFYRYPL